jgi:HAD superfamily hydrolase (TIGR01484 family)
MTDGSRLAPLKRAKLAHVRGVFTDVDGTLTTSGRLKASTLTALEQLERARVPVVLVSGRPAGFAETWLRTLPVAAVIAENGGLYLVRGRSGALRKVYARAAPAARASERRRLVRTVAAAVRAVPGARLSSDSRFTEVDLAVDYNEDVKLGSRAADALEAFLRQRGIQAVRSSVHVNAWVGNFDKAWMVRRFLHQEWGAQLKPHDRAWVYVGDSFNDAPLFEAFHLSIGVANVLDVLSTLEAAPRYVTRSPEGRGFEEVARAILRQRARR